MHQYQTLMWEIKYEVYRDFLYYHHNFYWDIADVEYYINYKCTLKKKTKPVLKSIIYLRNVIKS